MIVGKLFCSISHTLTLLLIFYCFLSFIASYSLFLLILYRFLYLILFQKGALYVSLPSPLFPCPLCSFWRNSALPGTSSLLPLSSLSFLSFLSLDAISKKEISYLPTFSPPFLLFLASLPYSAKALSKARENHRVFTSFPL